MSPVVLALVVLSQPVGLHKALVSRVQDLSRPDPSKFGYIRQRGIGQTDRTTFALVGIGPDDFLPANHYIDKQYGNAVAWGRLHRPVPPETPTIEQWCAAASEPPWRCRNLFLRPPMPPYCPPIIWYAGRADREPDEGDPAFDMKQMAGPRNARPLVLAELDGRARRDWRLTWIEPGEPRKLCVVDGLLRPVVSVPLPAFEMPPNTVLIDWGCAATPDGVRGVLGEVPAEMGERPDAAGRLWVYEAKADPPALAVWRAVDEDAVRKLLLAEFPTGAAVNTVTWSRPALVPGTHRVFAWATCEVAVAEQTALVMLLVLTDATGELLVADAGARWPAEKPSHACHWDGLLVAERPWSDDPRWPPAGPPLVALDPDGGTMLSSVNLVMSRWKRQ